MPPDDTALLCYGAVAQLLAPSGGTTTDLSMDELHQLVQTWSGLLPKTWKTTATTTTRHGSSTSFIEVALALQRALGNQPTSSPIVLMEKEVKVFRDPQDEAKELFLLRPLTHLSRCLGPNPGCIIIECCRHYMVVFFQPVVENGARPVIYWDMTEIRDKRLVECSFPALSSRGHGMELTNLRDAQLVIFATLRRVWESSHQRTGGHVSLWLVLPASLPATIRSNIECDMLAIRKKEKALAILKRRQELDRLAKWVVQEEQKDRNPPPPPPSTGVDENIQQQQEMPRTLRRCSGMAKLDIHKVEVEQRPDEPPVSLKHIADVATSCPSRQDQDNDIVTTSTTSTTTHGHHHRLHTESSHEYTPRRDQGLTSCASDMGPFINNPSTEAIDAGEVRRSSSTGQLRGSSRGSIPAAIDLMDNGLSAGGGGSGSQPRTAEASPYPIIGAIDGMGVRRHDLTGEPKVDDLGSISTPADLISKDLSGGGTRPRTAEVAPSSATYEASLRVGSSLDGNKSVSGVLGAPLRPRSRSVIGEDAGELYGASTSTTTSATALPPPHLPRPRTADIASSVTNRTTPRTALSVDYGKSNGIQVDEEAFRRLNLSSREVGMRDKRVVSEPSVGHGLRLDGPRPRTAEAGSSGQYRTMSRMASSVDYGKSFSRRMEEVIGRSSPMKSRLQEDGRRSRSGDLDGNRPWSADAVQLGTVYKSMDLDVLKSMEGEDLEAFSGRLYEAIKKRVVNSQPTLPVEEDLQLSSHGPLSASSSWRAPSPQPEQCVPLEENRLRYSSMDNGDDDNSPIRQPFDSTPGSARTSQAVPISTTTPVLDVSNALQRSSSQELHASPPLPPPSSSTISRGDECEANLTVTPRDVGGDDRSFSDLLESMDGEDIEFFSRRLYEVCKIQAVGQPTTMEDREGNDGPISKQSVGNLGSSIEAPEGEKQGDDIDGMDGDRDDHEKDDDYQRHEDQEVGGAVEGVHLEAQEESESSSGGIRCMEEDWGAMLRESRGRIRPRRSPRPSSSEEGEHAEQPSIQYANRQVGQDEDRQDDGDQPPHVNRDNSLLCTPPEDSGGREGLTWSASLAHGAILSAMKAIQNDSMDGGLCTVDHDLPLGEQLLGKGSCDGSMENSWQGDSDVPFVVLLTQPVQPPSQSNLTQVYGEEPQTQEEEIIAGTSDEYGTFAEDEGEALNEGVVMNQQEDDKEEVGTWEEWPHEGVVEEVPPPPYEESTDNWYQGYLQGSQSTEANVHHYSQSGCVEASAVDDQDYGHDDPLPCTSDPLPGQLDETQAMGADSQPNGGSPYMEPSYGQQLPPSSTYHYSSHQPHQDTVYLQQTQEDMVEPEDPTRQWPSPQAAVPSASGAEWTDPQVASTPPTWLPSHTLQEHPSEAQEDSYYPATEALAPVTNPMGYEQLPPRPREDWKVDVVLEAPRHALPETNRLAMSCTAPERGGLRGSNDRLIRQSAERWQWGHAPATSIGGGGYAPLGDVRPPWETSEIEWRMRVTREKLAEQDQMDQQKRQEESMKVKMEALRCVLGMATATSTMTPPVYDQPLPPPPRSAPTMESRIMANARSHGHIHERHAATPASTTTILPVRTGGTPPVAPHIMAGEPVQPYPSHAVQSAVPEPPLFPTAPGPYEDTGALEPVQEVGRTSQPSSFLPPVVEREVSSPSTNPWGRQTNEEEEDEQEERDYDNHDDNNVVVPPGGGVNAATASPSHEVLEVDMENLSQEEKKRRQQRFENLRARKMREAQERDEAKRQRQVHQPTKPSPEANKSKPRPLPSPQPPPPTTNENCDITNVPFPTPPVPPPHGRTYPPPTRPLVQAKGGRGVSNAKLIRNALCHVCLAGTILEAQRTKALQAMDQYEGGNFVILFNSSKALTFRGLYVLVPGDKEGKPVKKISGAGPGFLRGCFVAVVNREGWVDGFYKYNSAGRVFQPVPSKSFSVMTDGVSLDVTQLRRAAKEAAASGFVL